jgi:hypothetical protein
MSVEERDARIALLRDEVVKLVGAHIDSLSPDECAEIAMLSLCETLGVCALRHGMAPRPGGLRSLRECVDRLANLLRNAPWEATALLAVRACDGEGARQP